PVVRERMHWVMAEATMAAWALGRHLGTDGSIDYAAHYHRWWEVTDRRHVDREDGNWHHELDRDNRPAGTVWSGKPDVYHAYQATPLPPPFLAPAVAGGLLPPPPPQGRNSRAHRSPGSPWSERTSWTCCRPGTGPMFCARSREEDLPTRLLRPHVWGCRHVSWRGSETTPSAGSSASVCSPRGWTRVVCSTPRNPPRWPWPPLDLTGRRVTTSV